MLIPCVLNVHCWGTVFFLITIFSLDVYHWEMFNYRKVEDTFIEIVNTDKLYLILTISIDTYFDNKI